jgi:hypothetical protein
MAADQHTLFSHTFQSPSQYINPPSILSLGMPLDEVATHGGEKLQFKPYDLPLPCPSHLLSAQRIVIVVGYTLIDLAEVSETHAPQHPSHPFI